MVEWSIDAFRACGSVRSIVVAAPPGHVDELAGHPDLGVVPGGATRAQSVANALEAVGTELVAIHDAARPLVTPELVEALVARLDADPEAAGVIAAAPVTDTVKQATGSPTMGSSPAFPSHGTENAGLVGRAERSIAARLWAAQTPQVFRTEALREALAVDPEAHGRRYRRGDAGRGGGGDGADPPVPAQNFKVTTPLDLRVAELLLAERAAGAAPAESVPEQDPDQRRREAELADPEGDAEVDRAEQAGDRGAAGEGEQEEEQLTGHRGGSLGSCQC